MMSLQGSAAEVFMWDEDCNEKFLDNCLTFSLFVIKKWLKIVLIPNQMQMNSTHMLSYIMKRLYMSFIIVVFDLSNFVHVFFSVQHVRWIKLTLLIMCLQDITNSHEVISLFCNFLYFILPCSSSIITESLDAFRYDWWWAQVMYGGFYMPWLVIYISGYV